MLKFTLIFLVPALLGSAIDGPSVKSGHFDLNDISSHSLTLNELKLFAGHSLNLVKSNCPMVDPVKINQIQKYISKRIAHLNPKLQQEDPTFGNIIRTLKSCVKEAQPGSNSDDNTSKNLRLLGPSLSDLLGESVYESNPGSDSESVIRVVMWPGVDSENPDSQGGAVFDPESFIVPILSGIGNPEIADLEKAPTIESPETEPIPAEPALPTKSIEIEKPIAIVTESAKTPAAPAKNHNFNVSSWFSGIWSSISSFFQRNFGIFRHRRSATPEETQNGAQKFTSFFDRVCRIYCQCAEVTIDFKEAAQDLLKFLFQEAESLNQAAGNLLDDDLIKSLQECA